MAVEFKGTARAQVFDSIFNADSTDCCFHFTNDTKKISAHQKVLALMSPVFATMFSNSWFDTANGIVIEDTTYESFDAFIGYFYKDSVAFTEDNVGNIMYLADKYDVQELFDGCETFMINHLSSTNAFEQYSIASRFGCNRLKSKCHTIFSQQYKHIMESSAFLQCNIDSLAGFLQLLPKQYDVGKVFDSCIAWAKAKCQQKNGDQNASMENIRAELGQCFNIIRFVDMDSEAFFERYKTYKAMFTKEESDDIVIQLFQNIQNRKSTYTWTSMPLGDGGLSGGIFRFRVTKTLILHKIFVDTSSKPPFFIAIVCNDRDVVRFQSDENSGNIVIVPGKTVIVANKSYKIRIACKDGSNGPYLYERQRLGDAEIIPVHVTCNVLCSDDCNKDTTSSNVISSVEFVDVGS